MSRRLRRGLVVAGIVLVVLALGGYLGLRAVLASGYARDLVASKVSAAVGLPVTVDHLSVGRSAQSVGLTVGDFLTVKNAAVAIPLASLARGDTAAGPVTLTGVRVELRLDANGKVLTPLPKGGGGSGGTPQVPPVHVEDTTVVIAQDGRPPFTLGHVTGDLTQDGQLLRVTAKAADPQWGTWTAAGTIDLATKDVRFELTNPDAPLRLDLLRSVPWVPHETWEQVHPSGSSPCTVTLDYQDKPDQFTYGVVLTPKGAGLGLPGLDVALAELAGTVRIGGPVVKLEGTTAKLADGTLGLDGVLDFGPDPSNLHFNAKVQGVDVLKLPAEWGLQKQKISGKLRGTADLTVLIHPGGRVETRGEGRGDLDGATVAGFPAEVRLRLRGDGKRFRFEDASEPPPMPDPKAGAQLPDSGPRGVASGGQESPVPANPGVFSPGRGHSPRLAQGADASRSPLLTLVSLLQPAAPASSLGASVTLREVDIAELLKRLEVKLDYRLAGRVTVVARVAVPVSGDAADKTTVVRGSFTSKQLGFEGLVARDVSADLLYSNGVVTLSALKAAFDPDTPGGPAGSLVGTATAGVNPAGDLKAKLTLSSVPLGQVLRAVPGGPIPASGPVSGTAEFTAPVKTVTDAGNWSATAELTAPTLVAAGRTITGVRLPLRVAGGKAVLAGGVATVEGIPLTADTTVTLAGQYAYTAIARTDPRDVATLTKLVPELALSTPVTGKLALTANAAGTLSPTTVKAEGTVAARELSVGRSTANSITADWALTPERVTVGKLDAAVFNGKLTGSADVPFAADQAGRFEVNLLDVDAAGLAAAVPDVPVKVTGKLSGRVVGTIPPGTPRTAEVSVDVTAPRLTLQGILAEKLVGSVKVLRGGIDYKLTGKALGGDLDVEGRYPQGDAPADPKAQPGRVSLRGADLRRLGEGVRSAAQLGGRVDLHATFGNDFQTGSGTVAVRYLSWNDEPLADEIRGRLAVRGGFLELNDLQGGLAGGQLRGRGRVNLQRPVRNFFQLTLDDADARGLVGPFGGGDALDGRVGAAVRLRVYPEVRGTVELSVAHGRVGGIDATGLRLPVEFETAGGTRLRVAGASTAVGDGRADVDASYDLGGGGRLQGQVRFRDVSVARLGGPESLVGGGRVSGRFDFAGESVKSATDITGRLTGTIRQANVRELPVLAAVTPFLSPAAIAGPFDRGDVRGSLRGGVFRLERLALQSERSDLFADGTITLQKRLDLRVVARTGNLSGNLGLLRTLGARIPAIGPIPIGLILDISTFLSNRTVRLDVGGTTDRPAVRVNTSALLAEEAVRFLLSRYLPGVEAAREALPGEKR